jgi:hypothetical protein
MLAKKTIRSVELGVALGALTLVAACSRPAGRGENAPASSPEFLPRATIQDLMEFEIDPAADSLWGSVGTIVTAAGVEERKPRTDQQWRELRHKAIALVEATNLLLIPGREVASEKFASAGPGVLSSDEIARRLSTDPSRFAALTLALREVALRGLSAIDAKDADALSSAGEALDGACEACHVANWYPHQIIPALPDFK